VAAASGCAGIEHAVWLPLLMAVDDPQPSQKTVAASTAATTTEAPVIIRGQSPGYGSDPLPGGYSRGPQPVSGGAPPPPYPGLTTAPPAVQQPAYGAPQMPPAYGPPAGPPQPYAQPAAPPPQYSQPYQPQAQNQPYTPPPYAGQPVAPQQPSINNYQPPSNPPSPSISGNLPAPPADAMSGLSGGISPITPGYPGFQPPTNLPPEINATPTPLDVYVEETRTGQFMFGVTVNSNAGLIGNIVLSERNFDITNPATSWDDFAVGRAWRGGGQGFRLEAQPGTVLQRYLVSFTDPYFLSTNISFDASAYYFNRLYFDWTEARAGGRLAWGYRLTPDLAIATALRAENIDIFNPRVRGVPELEAVLGHSNIFSGKVTLTHDTRDIPFSPTQGHLYTASFEQAFGQYSFPRGDFGMSQYFLIRQRPDGSGRHTAGFITTLGFLGNNAPIFEDYFAGGFGTLRGFQFRGASPQDNGVTIGGKFQWLNSAEYYFPLTADDMIRGTVFCDFGTVEKSVSLHPDEFRVAPGFGFRINVPAMGPAPLAFDFAFPVASASTDHRQMFSFFFGASR
jgi:outer membrane protein insertion porin family